jgi:GalNAc5-diNAcBac-PP-undecaprenol beta-1,3-glucosyltransferase
MCNRPTFSVIIPTHRRANLLRRALQSVKSQEAPVSFEVIVVSDVIDNETDMVCTELLTAADTFLRRSGHPGPSASRNQALALARGRYIIFLDDDDAWHPGCLAQLCAQPILQQGRSVYFNCSVVSERRLSHAPEMLSETELNLEGRLTSAVYVKNQVHMSCFVFPRRLLSGLTFDESMRAYEDWDYLLAVFDREMPVHIPLLGSRVFEVKDDTSDRRGSSQKATDFNAVLDYLYVYRRHVAPTMELKQQRAALLAPFGLQIVPEML